MNFFRRSSKWRFSVRNVYIFHCKLRRVCFRVPPVFGTEAKDFVIIPTASVYIAGFSIIRSRLQSQCSVKADEILMTTQKLEDVCLQLFNGITQCGSRWANERRITSWRCWKWQMRRCRTKMMQIHFFMLRMADKSIKLHHCMITTNEIFLTPKNTNYFESSRTATELKQSEYAVYDVPAKPCIVSLHAHEGVNIVFKQTSSITRHFVAAQSDILKPANI